MCTWPTHPNTEKEPAMIPRGYRGLSLMKGASSDGTWPIVRIQSDAVFTANGRTLSVCLYSRRQTNSLKRMREPPQTHHKGSRHNRTKETCSVTLQKEEKKDWKKQVRRGWKHPTKENCQEFKSLWWPPNLLMLTWIPLSLSYPSISMTTL